MENHMTKDMEPNLGTAIFVVILFFLVSMRASKDSRSVSTPKPKP